MSGLTLRARLAMRCPITIVVVDALTQVGHHMQRQLQVIQGKFESVP